MAKFGINDILNAKTKAAGQQAQTDGYKEIYLSPYEVKAAQENTHQKLENIEELADSFLHVESYGTPKKMAEAMSADLSVKTADGSLYADDTLSESVTEFASGTLKLGIKDLTPEVLAELLGQAVDKNSVVWAGKEDEPPYVAVGFRAKKTGGKYRYVWLLKAKFKVPSEKYETKGESIKFNTPDIEASFTTRKKDNLWKADFVGTEESAAAKTWFTAVPEKAAAMESV